MSDTADDERPWGWISDGTWRQLPKGPMLDAGLGPPPFSVTLPSNEVRQVIYEPENQKAGG